MGCLKCGRDTQEGAVFCPECLLEMQRYPVRPGTPVMLPSRERVVPKKAPKRRAVPPEEQIKGLKKKIRTLTILWIAALLAFVILAVVCLRVLPYPQYRPGQNYTAIPSTTAPVVSSASALPSEPVGSVGQ